MSLSKAERNLLRSAGSDRDPVARQRAVGILLSKSSADADEAGGLLVEGYLHHIRPSFHLIPRGDSMLEEADFDDALAALADGTRNFAEVDAASLGATLHRAPAALAPLRMILGLTYSELAVALRLLQPALRTSGSALKSFERSPATDEPAVDRAGLVEAIAETVMAVMNRQVLEIPPSASPHFHSKLDKLDTIDGWASVHANAGGVPYSALLYQRYVGGVWRQVQDAYSEVKGDAILEYPLRDLLDAHDIPYHHSGRGRSGARGTVDRYGMSPGPDFVIPDESPTLVVESKVDEDGGTVRDKAARISAFADAATDRGLTACALVEGKGWSERPAALLEVIVATQGRTYSLATLDQILELPEIRALRN